MTTAQHTPGPWHAVFVKANTVAYINGHETSTLATLKAPFGNVARMNADARLIAAAPDLLAACIAAEAEMSSVYRLGLVDSLAPKAEHSTFTLAGTQLRVAINAAKGE